MVGRLVTKKYESADCKLNFREVRSLIRNHFLRFIARVCDERVCDSFFPVTSLYYSIDCDAPKWRQLWLKRWAERRTVELTGPKVSKNGPS